MPFNTPTKGRVKKRTLNRLSIIPPIARTVGLYDAQIEQYSLWGGKEACSNFLEAFIWSGEVGAPSEITSGTITVTNFSLPPIVVRDIKFKEKIRRTHARWS